MFKVNSIKSALVGTSCLGLLVSAVQAEEFNIPSGDLTAALNAYAAQTGVQLVVSAPAVRGVYSHGVKGNLSPERALSQVLNDTGFGAERRSSGAIAIVKEQTQSNNEEPIAAITLAQAQSRAPSVETVTVDPNCDHRAKPRTVDVHSNSWRPRSREAGAEPDVLQNELHRL